MSRKINHLAVWTLVILHQIIGWIWYGPIFGAQWMRLMNFNPEDVQPTALPFIISIVSAAFMVYILAWLFNRLNVTTIPQGLKVSLLIWLGITALEVATLYMFQGHSFSLWAVDMGKSLVNYALTGIVLSTWTRES